MKNFFAIVLLVGAIGLFFGYTYKKYQEIKEVRTDVVELKKDLEQSVVILAKRDELKKKYTSFKQADLEALDSLLPDYVDNIKLVLDMNSIAKLYGITLRGIKVDEEKESKVAATTASKANFGSINISFKVTSTYENFVQFLRDLERSLRIVDVTALSFKSTETGVYDFNVSLRTYWLNK